MPGKFVVIAKPEPTEFLKKMNSSRGHSAGEVTYQRRLADMFKSFKNDVEYAGAIIYETDESRLGGQLNVIQGLLEQDPWLQVIVPLPPGTNVAAVMRGFRAVSTAVTVLPTQDPGAVRQAMNWCLQRRASQMRNTADDFDQRWRTMCSAFGRALEQLDRITWLHSVGVMCICDLVARKIKRPYQLRGHLFQLKVGAVMHDAGKLAIPREILQSDRQLSDEERLIINSHPEEGMRDALAMADFPAFLPGGLRATRLQQYVIKHALWPFFVLTHHWAPLPAGERPPRPYPEKLSHERCRDYLDLLGGTKGAASLTDSIVPLFDQKEIAGGLGGEQLLVMWAIIHFADIIDARRFPRPYHRKDPPPLNLVIADIEKEARTVAAAHPRYEGPLNAVAQAFRSNIKGISDCLSNRGGNWL